MDVKWNHVATSKKESGYEDVLDDLKAFTKEVYVAADEVAKEEMIDRVFDIYRAKNIFPITYYNKEGIREEIQACFDKKIEWKDHSVLNFGYNQGQSLCRFLFPNIYEVEVKGAKNNSPYHRFHDDHKLRRAIKFCFDHKKVTYPAVPSALKDGLEMIGGNVATNFKAMNAKALFERYCKKGDMILDFSSGFGGRMLGAAAAGCDYIGFEPCKKTFINLQNLIREIQVVNPMFISTVFNKGSEDFVLSEIADFAFSSPPYFNLESYSDEPTQCYNKFPVLEEWFDGYVEPTIKNIHRALKPGKFYAVNIADFKVGKNEVNYVSRWIDLSIKNGFVPIETISMKLQSRRGDGHDETNKKSKQEGIFVFQKV